MVLGGCECWGYIEDEGSISPRASLEEERIKKNLSEGEKVSSFLVKRIYFLRESIFSAKFFFNLKKKKEIKWGVHDNDKV